MNEKEGEVAHAEARLRKAEANLKKYQNEPAPDEVREWLEALKALEALRVSGAS